MPRLTSSASHSNACSAKRAANGLGLPSPALLSLGLNPSDRNLASHRRTSRRRFPTGPLPHIPPLEFPGIALVNATTPVSGSPYQIIPDVAGTPSATLATNCDPSGEYRGR